MLRIGNLNLKSSLILAPMAGVSDLPFRMLNRKFGCELAFTEMLNVRSLSYKSKKTKQMLYSNSKDRPLGIQLLGSEPKFILQALEILREYRFDIIDFNAACPARKVVRRGEGASLLKEPKKLGKLLRMIVKKTKVPVTVKIRTGWDRVFSIKTIAAVCQDSGISGVFIHGRTKEQGYRDQVDYRTIRELKSVVKIPVIASGDIFSGQLAKRMFDETGCDGILIARGALGNPWIFKEIFASLKNKKPAKKATAKKIANTMIEHLNMCIDFYDEKIAVKLFRKFFVWYTKGFPKIRPLREKFSRAKTKNDMMRIIRACIDS